MEVVNYIPHPALREEVFSVSTVDAALPDGVPEVVTPYPPTPFQSLIFYINHPIRMGRTGDSQFRLQPRTVIIGPQYSRVNICVMGFLRAVRVDFLPGGLHRMLGVPMHELFDEGFDAEIFLGASLRNLNQRLSDTVSLSECRLLVEQFLLSHLENRKGKLPFDLAMLSLMRSNGLLPIHETAAMSCLSLKQFERRCMERIGMNPKSFARILRFSRAYRLHESAPLLPWTAIAYEAGYFDQMHLIRDFKTFAGVNPSVIEQELKETPLRMQRHLPDSQA